MKKIVTLCAAVLLAMGLAFAQSADSVTSSSTYVDTSTQVRKIEDKYAEFHPTARNVELEMEYTPLTGEVIVYYTCLVASYDQGEAMNTVDAVLEDFGIENKFTRRPTFVKKDRTRYFKDGRDLKMATFRRWVRYNDK